MSFACCDQSFKKSTQEMLPMYMWLSFTNFAASAVWDLFSTYFSDLLNNNYKHCISFKDFYWQINLIYAKSQFFCVDPSPWLLQLDFCLRAKSWLMMIRSFLISAWNVCHCQNFSPWLWEMGTKQSLHSVQSVFKFSLKTIEGFNFSNVF